MYAISKERVNFLRFQKLIYEGSAYHALTSSFMPLAELYEGTATHS